MNHRKITAVLGACLLLGLAAAAWAAVQAMSVQVRAGRVLDSPNCFGRLIQTLPYGAKVKAVDERGQWYRLQSPAGWIHQSALSDKQIVLRAGDKTKTGADSQEMTLAGKGFNRQVEDRYRASGRGNYAAVDKAVRSDNFSQDQLRQFMAEGGLGGGGGQ